MFAVRHNSNPDAVIVLLKAGAGPDIELEKYGKKYKAIDWAGMNDVYKNDAAALQKVNMAMKTFNDDSSSNFAGVLSQVKFLPILIFLLVFLKKVLPRHDKIKH
jgi:hypothetical protein